MQKPPDWRQIVALYEELLRLHPSAVVAVNQAVAVSMAYGPKSSLNILTPLKDILDQYYPFWVALADALRRDGQVNGSIEALERALELCKNVQEHAYLNAQLQQLLAE